MFFRAVHKLPEVRNSALVYRKVLYTNAKETRDTWSDEETYFSAKKNTGNI